MGISAITHTALSGMLAQTARALHAGMDDARLTQDADVVRHRGLADLEPGVVLDLPAGRLADVGQRAYGRQARGIGQGGQNPGQAQLLGRGVNHVFAAVPSGSLASLGHGSSINQELR